MIVGWMVSAFRSREDLVLENLALRQQLLALHAQRPCRRLTALHKLFWVALKSFWSVWRKPLILVTPRTVVNWHQSGWSRTAVSCAAISHLPFTFLSTIRMRPSTVTPALVAW